ncbi:hypothetical protein [Streptomyces sp. NRRL B-24484]|uniref:hypothetical protein n=1 Tax=Streptomyces sp. NRRL B-24484 TaxID=1463833 RepID=UPI0004BF4CF9|nr:hypothetical protein [Streptomyces sp. NRRL B-24484]
MKTAVRPVPAHRTAPGRDGTESGRVSTFFPGPDNRLHHVEHPGGDRPVTTCGTPRSPAG